MQLEERELHQKCLAWFKKLKSHLGKLHMFWEVTNTRPFEIAFQREVQAIKEIGKWLKEREIHQQESLVTKGTTLEASSVIEGASLEAYLVTEGAAYCSFILLGLRGRVRTDWIGRFILLAEYDLWSMRMEQYLTFTDHALWEVIVNSDSVIPVTSASADAEGPIPPKIAEQKLSRKNELKAKLLC
ncbi:hypothetical protein Tco_1103255 [Tanacetum coccineum]